MNKFTIIPASLSYQSAPKVDQKVTVTLEEKQQQITEYDRNATISLENVFESERQASRIYRPTFKINYLYSNTLTGTTNYTPFRNNLFYVNSLESTQTNIWKGFPQYYEFDFYRPDINDQHLDYYAKSAYTYNWSYYFSYPFQNNPNQVLYTNLVSINSWIAKDGIPFSIQNTTFNGSNVIAFQCVAPHGLSVGEYVRLSFKYGIVDLFEVYSLGNGQTDSDEYIFNIFNYGYTGTTFNNGKVGTFKRVVNPNNVFETTSDYYVRQNKILTGVDDALMTKSGFEKNIFSEEKQLQLSSLTPNFITTIAQKTSSNAYNVTSSYDLDITTLIDNQKRPLSELFLTIIHKGYTGYFYDPSNPIGIKRGWEFNLSSPTNPYWDRNNTNSNSNLQISTYTKQNYTFAFTKNLNVGDIIDGDFCEWNNYEQIERVVSPLYHKINFNPNVFTHLPIREGYYYKPHHSMTLRVFSDYVETANVGSVDNVPSYSYYSSADRQFRWRDLYDYGFFDNIGRGVDYPFLNSAHYPFTSIVFRLIPEGVNFNDNLFGINFPIKPLFDECA